MIEITYSVSSFIRTTLCFIVMLFVVPASATDNDEPQQQRQLGFTPMPNLLSFDYFESVHRESQRAAVTLAVDCNQGFDPCLPRGTCANGRCICDSEPQKGFWSGDDCKECDVGWAGQECKIECKGGACSRCSGHGDCNEGVAGDGSCRCQQEAHGYWDGPDCGVCKTGYFGVKCDKSCPGAEFGSACWGRGECRSNELGEGVCVCDPGYESALGCYDCDASSYGLNCVSKCDGYNASLNRPCSGHGVCFNGTSQNGTCTCDPGFGLFDCSLHCPGNGTAVCSGHGKCSQGINGDATCHCDGLWSPPDCAQCYDNVTDPKCGSACPTNLANIPCSGHGTCAFVLDIAVCICSSGYNGTACEFACPGSPPCSGNGECDWNTATGSGVCRCAQNSQQGYWDGATCDVCDVRFNNSANCATPCPTWGGKVCNGRGACFNGVCTCDRSTPERLEYCGRACETASAPNIVDSNLNCLQCTCEYCNDPFAAGDCVTSYCPRVTSTDPAFACGGRGRCLEGRTRPGQCYCYSGWTGDGCEFGCPVAGNKTCSGFARGVCKSTQVTDPDTNSVSTSVFCDCRPGYAGAACEIMCPRWNDQVCSGHGVCRDTYAGDGSCKCSTGWTGRACNVPCACNIWNGVCDNTPNNATSCFNKASTDVCYKCVCTGNYTDLCQRCKPGIQGRNCEGLCVHGNTSGKVCLCDEFWSGPACDIPCPRDNVNNTICGDRGVCLWGNTQAGTCKCKMNWYGLNCSNYCDPEICRSKFGLVNPQCNALTGTCECQNTVAGRWSGASCESCVEGYFGQNCEQSCVCSNHGTCDKDSGDCQCYQSPTRGYYSGQQCDTCTTGYIGSNCERKSVAYTRVTPNIDPSPELKFSPFLFGSVPSTDVMFIDEVLERTYAGGFPLVQLDSNMSSPRQMTPLRVSSTDSFHNAVLSSDNASAVQCYNEVAYVFVHEDDIFFLMHPQIQCNVSVRLLRQRRVDADLNFSSAEVIWQMPVELSKWPACKGCAGWGNRTSRVVAADSISDNSLLVSDIKDPILSFIMAEPVRTQLNAWEPSCIVVRVRIAQALSFATRGGAATGKYLNSTYQMTSITLRQAIGAETSGKTMLAGRRQGMSTFDTWEVLEFEWFDGSGFYPEDPGGASIRDSIACWPQIADLATSAVKCDQCSSVGGAYYWDNTILLGMNHPDTAFAVWVRPFDDSIKFTKQFPAKLRNKCETARYDQTTNQIVGLSTGLETRDLPSWVVFVASAAAPGTDIVSMAIDRAVAQLHFSLTVFPTSSIMIKFTFASGDLSILGTKSLGFVSTVVVGGAFKPQPEVFSHLYADSHARVLYGIHSAVTPLKLSAFLLYDTLEVSPSIADQRGGTKIIVNGTGFKLIMKAGSSNIPLVKPTCRFSNQAPVEAADLTPTGLTCTTTAVSEADIAASCGRQQVEVSLFGSVWFTENKVALRRVRAAKIEGAVVPQRGPLDGLARVSFAGTGFVDSPFAVCRFFSNSTTSANKEVLISTLHYTSRGSGWCAQPPAKFASPDYSFLDVSLDGQLFMETTPPTYTIVGAAENVSAPDVITFEATDLAKVDVEVEIVDKLHHWVGSLDSRPRAICMALNVTEPTACDENLLPWRELGDGYPWGPCRPNYYVLANSSRCRDVPPQVGRILWNDLFFVQPRTGTFDMLITYAEDPERWRTLTTFKIVPGAPFALALSNRKAIADRPNFIKNLPLTPAPEIIVLDSLGNKIDNPPAALTVYAQQVFRFDTNESLAWWIKTEQKKSPDADNVRFNTIFLPFINGVTVFVNFTSNLDLRNTLSPPLRTSLCDNSASRYKVPLTSDCATCPPEGATCNGTEVIVVSPGYWRASSDINIYKCPGGEYVCLGSLNAPNGSFCAEGYDGPLCSLCQHGWGKSGSTKCQPCGEVGSSIAIIVVTAVFLIMALTGWTINLLRQAQVTDLSIILRTVVNHMQATGKLGEFSTQWDPFLKSVFDVQNSVSGLSFSGLSSLSCIISASGSDHQAIFIGYMALPSLTVVMTGLVLLTVRALRLKPVLTEKLRADVIEEVKNMPSARIGILLEKYPWYTVATTTISIFMFTLYQTLITQATAVLTCRELTIAPGVTQQYLAVDMSIKCDSSGGHKFKTAAYLAAVAYGVGIPAGFVFGYRVVLQSIGNKDLVGMMFQFLIGGYKPQYWYWQAVIMVRKLVLVLVITFIGDNPQLQSYGGMWTMAVALVLQIWFEPYERDVFNRVEALSLAIITVTLNLGLLYYWDNMPVFGKSVLTAFLILVTVGVIIMFAYYMYEPIKDTVQDKVRQLRQMYTDYQDAKNAPRDDKSLQLRNTKMNYIEDEDEGVVHFDKYQGAARDKSQEFNANFGDVDDLGALGRASPQHQENRRSVVAGAGAGAGAGGRERGLRGSGNGKRAGKEKRAMPVLNDNDEFDEGEEHRSGGMFLDL